MDSVGRWPHSHSQGVKSEADKWAGTLWRYPRSVHSSSRPIKHAWERDTPSCRRRINWCSARLEASTLMVSTPNHCLVVDPSTRDHFIHSCMGRISCLQVPGHPPDVVPYTLGKPDKCTHHTHHTPRMGASPPGVCRRSVRRQTHGH